MRSMPRIALNRSTKWGQIDPAESINPGRPQQTAKSIPVHPNESQRIASNPNRPQAIPTNRNRSQPTAPNPNQSQSIPTILYSAHNAICAQKGPPETRTCRDESAIVPRALGRGGGRKSRKTQNGRQRAVSLTFRRARGLYFEIGNFEIKIKSCLFDLTEYDKQRKRPRKKCTIRT